MPTAYKTPGVYVEEIPKFPPSIAAVETAIPAFIGYTEKAQRFAPGDLLNVPTRIQSIREFEAYFGVGSTPSVTSVTLDDNRNFKSAVVGNSFYTYDSLRLFYANGGGDCYVVSTGTYDSAGKTAADFTGSDKALDALLKVDEPTILVFPDNSLLTAGTDFYSVYQAALAQCAELMDRVGLLHTKEADPKGDEFRSLTGINDLKYGAAYSPWLEVNLPKDISYRGFMEVISIGGSKFNLGDLTTNKEIQDLVGSYEKIIADVDTIAKVSKALAVAPGATLRDQFNTLESAYLKAKDTGTLGSLMNFLFSIARSVDKLVAGGADPLLSTELIKAATDLIDPTLKGIYTQLISYEKELEKELSATLPPVVYGPQYVNNPPQAVGWNQIFNANNLSGPQKSTVIADAILNGNIPASPTAPVEMDLFFPLLQLSFDQINDAWLGSIVATAQELEKTKHDGLLNAFPLYKSIVAGIQNASTTVPPSGAVAGIYAYVDRTRGVWKAPANVSLSGGVIGPADTFTASELDALNVDSNSGKSINAIRSFTGKGTLVFGARTLAGNDNEWRYVSVRRFFNFVEESVKKATEQFVFEPNDANTWVKIQAMTENFLTTLWRQGALQGIKPEHAFYVAVGLGKTMTPLDILEGRLIVEIGMAAVRPAEFIILRFSHKMAES